MPQARGASPAMPSGGGKLQALRDFLTTAFRPFELEAFLKLNGYEEAAVAVNWDAPLVESSLRLLEALDHRGLVDADFFRRLGEARQARGAEIEALRGAWLGDTPARPGPPGRTHEPGDD